MHYGPCPIVRDCLAVYPALFLFVSLQQSRGNPVGYYSSLLYFAFLAHSFFLHPLFFICFFLISLLFFCSVFLSAPFQSSFFFSVILIKISSLIFLSSFCLVFTFFVFLLFSFFFFIRSLWLPFRSFFSPFLLSLFRSLSLGFC